MAFVFLLSSLETTSSERKQGVEPSVNRSRDRQSTSSLLYREGALLVLEIQVS